jgi:AcrR family transcriptional regulator
MATIRDADGTRARILEAAAEEFGALGIAGARIDRIAVNAAANKAMIYRYFGSKDELFDAVFTAHVVQFLEAARFDASDLPGYAERLYDSYQDDPRTLRLTHWYQLERPDSAPLRAIAGSHQDKLRGIAEAQEAGRLPADYAPVELLALVRGIAMSWDNLAPELGTKPPKFRERRRAIVRDAVRRLVSMDPVPDLSSPPSLQAR